MVVEVVVGLADVGVRLRQITPMVVEVVALAQGSIFAFQQAH